MKNEIQKLIDKEFDPSLTRHRGSIQVISVERKSENLIVEIKFESYSPSIDMTLIMIEFFLRDELSAPTLQVINTDDL